ncbi:MAG: hypothetical protein KatS3mg060_3597 [Dehalococcoidia bacterium]|nr:MAG: hypothetical protein KatS3mg060_3597 [Dehalococcoidia bacterium]
MSAKPGHSEHQLGTAIDFASAENGYELDESFANTREGKWLLANATRYGFVLSYPAGAESITGYAYEPWALSLCWTDPRAGNCSLGTSADRILPLAEPLNALEARVEDVAKRVAERVDGQHRDRDR